MLIDLRIKFFVCAVIFFSFFHLAAQDRNSDSLKFIVKNAKHDTDRVRALSLLFEEAKAAERDEYYNEIVRICEARLKSGNLNKAEERSFLWNASYAYNGYGYFCLREGKFREALSYFDKSIYCLKKIGNKKELAYTINNIGYSYHERGDNDNAMKYYEEALLLSKEAGDKRGIATISGCMAEVSFEKGDIEKAFDTYLKCLKLYEEEKDVDGQVGVYSSLGLMYRSYGHLDKATEFYEKAIAMADKTVDKRTIATICNNIAQVYRTTKQYEKSLKYYKYCLQLHRDEKNLYGEGFTLANMGALYQDMKQYDQALDYFKNALSIRKKLDDIKGIASSLYGIGNYYMERGDLAKAESYGVEAMTIAKKMKLPAGLRGISEFLYKIYKRTGKSKAALENYEMFVAMNDSLVSEQNKKAAIRSQLKYEYEKQAAADSVAHAKENEIKSAELSRQSAEIRAKKNQQYALFGGLALVMIFAGFMYNRFKVTQKQKAVIEDQKEIVEEQKKLVEEKQKEVLDSIYYAKRIQLAQIPSEKIVAKNLDRLKKKNF